CAGAAGGGSRGGLWGLLVGVTEGCVEPGARRAPLPLDGGLREPERLGRLLYGEPSEVAALDDLRLAGVEAGEAGEGTVEVEDRGGAGVGEDVRVGGVAGEGVEGDGGVGAAALGALARAGVVHEHLA